MTSNELLSSNEGTSRSTHLGYVQTEMGRRSVFVFEKFDKEGNRTFFNGTLMPTRSIRPDVTVDEAPVTEPAYTTDEAMWDQIDQMMSEKGIEPDTDEEEDER